MVLGLHYSNCRRLSVFKDGLDEVINPETSPGSNCCNRRSVDSEAIPLKTMLEAILLKIRFAFYRINSAKRLHMHSLHHRKKRGTSGTVKPCWHLLDGKMRTKQEIFSQVLHRSCRTALFLRKYDASTLYQSWISQRGNEAKTNCSDLSSYRFALETFAQDGTSMLSKKITGISSVHDVATSDSKNHVWGQSTTDAGSARPPGALDFSGCG